MWLAFDQPHALRGGHGAARSTPGRSTGTWTVARHAAVLDEPGGRIAFQFQARDVNLVMGPATRGASDPVPGLPRRPAGERRASGPTSAADGQRHRRRAAHVPADPPAGPIAERRFEIEFLDAGVEAYCFTFG